MATYPIINKETGEQKDIKLSVHEWDQWLEDNPEWQRDWSDPTTAPSCGNLEKFTTSSKSLILDGTMFCIVHLSIPVPTSSLFNLCLLKEKEISPLVSV